MHQSTPSLRERPPSAVHASWTARLIRAAARPTVIAGAAALFMAFAGAFGTGAAPLPQRLGYWIVTMVVCSVIGTVIFMSAYLRGWLADRPVLGSLMVGAAMSVPLTAVVWTSTALFFPGLSSTDPKDIPAYFPAVLAVSLVLTAINHLAADRAQRRLQTHAAPPGAAPARFLERLPLKLRGAELYAVEAEDHYLRLHTSRGSDLILMRLADAVAELEGIEGAQTHRSWWVAKAAVADARRSDGRATLTLKNGVEAPVSRSFAGTLRQSGWF